MHPKTVDKLCDKTWTIMDVLIDTNDWFPAVEKMTEFRLIREKRASTSRVDDEGKSNPFIRLLPSMELQKKGWPADGIMLSDTGNRFESEFIDLLDGGRVGLAPIDDGPPMRISLFYSFSAHQTSPTGVAHAES